MKDYLIKFSGTLIAALILILLMSYVYFFQMRKPVEEEKEKVFPAVGEKQINEISLKYPSYTVVCRKEGKTWFIFKGSQKFKADDRTISGMAENISQMKIEKIISENPTNLSGFGLDSPQVEVVAKTPEKKYRILIGDESPVGSGIYIRMDNDSRVLIVSRGSISEFLRKSANDLRDKQILSLEEDKINRLNFKSKDFSFEVEKKNGEWSGKDIPEYVEIDQTRVGKIVRTFANLRIDSFENDEPKNLSAYGLDNPSAEIELFENEKTIRVLFGNKKEKDYYVKLGSEDPVYSVSEFVFRQIPENVNDIRMRKVVKLDNEKVSALEIKRGDSRVSILKKGNGWEVGGDKNIKVDGSKVQELLEEVEGLEVEEFVDENPENLAPYGLEKPEIQITISESDKKKTLLFGKEENGKVYVKLADGKSVYLVSDEIRNSLKIP